jgi:plastin-1
VDIDGDGLLDQREIQQACKDTGYSNDYDEIRASLKQVTTSTTGKIDVEEFIEVSIIHGFFVIFFFFFFSFFVE